MLYSRASANINTTNQAVLVFLHGLLGSGQDWHSVTEHLSPRPYICLDLPGHGVSALDACRHFGDCCKQISDTLLTHIMPHRPIVLVGYSLGGRIAMSGIANGDFAQLNVQMLIVEGGNFGLSHRDAKQARWLSDSHWAARFRNEPIEQVLSDWYQQPVFSSLNHEQRQQLITKRSANLGPSVANMLEATSLAKQDDLLDGLKRTRVKTHFICGEKDHKFSQLAKLSGLSFSQVVNAGHNVHLEQPKAFADIINAQLKLNGLS